MTSKSTATIGKAIRRPRASRPRSCRRSSRSTAVACKNRSGGPWRCEPPRSTSVAPVGTGGARPSSRLNIARYDRAAAAAVLTPEVAAFGTTDVDTHRQAFVAMALVLIDPLRAVAMVEALPDDPGLDNTLPKNAARRMAAEMLAKHGDDRWKEARVWAVSMWRPVGSDL